MKVVLLVALLAVTAYASPVAEGEDVSSVSGAKSEPSVIDKLQEKVKEAAEKVKEGIKEASQKAKEALEKAKDKVKQAVEKTKEKIDDAAGKAEEGLDKADEKIDEGIDKAAEKTTEDTDKVEKKIEEDLEKLRGTVGKIESLIRKTVDSECADNKCTICAEIGEGHQVCADAILHPGELSITLDLKYNGQIIVSKKFDATNPPPVCAPIPYVKVVDLCFQPYDLEMKESGFHGCMKIELNAMNKQLAAIDLHCVDLGDSGENHSGSATSGEKSSEKTAEKSSEKTAEKSSE